MAETTAPTVVHSDDHYFGACSECGSNNGYINVGKGHWFVCDEHRIKWWAGSNLFSSWHDQTEAEQYAEWLPTAEYRDVSNPPLEERRRVSESMLKGLAPVADEPF